MSSAEHTTIAPAQAAVYPRLPSWLKKPIAGTGRKAAVERLLDSSSLHTVCEEAKCPNRAECFGRGTATFLIMGDTCTRNCGFCGVNKGCALPLDSDEPFRIAEAIRQMPINHAVITSVTRDDLPDGGANHFARVVGCIKKSSPAITIEVLTPDFQGNQEALMTVLHSKPDVFNHNIETVRRLYPGIRPQAQYDRSLAVLKSAAQSRLVAWIKSGIMVGLGEYPLEVLQTLKDLRDTGCSIVTIGQYLQPGKAQVPVASFIEPSQFDEYRKAGENIGLKKIVAGPFVRSSYHAGEVFQSCMSIHKAG
jgi:lipoyl synthase